MKCYFYDSATPEFYNGDNTLPIYQRNQPKSHYSLESLVRILLIDSLPTDMICTKQPIQVSNNVSFVVDLNMLDDPIDIRADENGVWKRKGSPVAYISLHSHNGKTNIFRRGKMAVKPTHYKVTRTYIIGILHLLIILV